MHHKIINKGRDGGGDNGNGQKFSPQPGNTCEGLLHGKCGISRGTTFVSHRENRKVFPIPSFLWEKLVLTLSLEARSCLILVRSFYSSFLQRTLLDSFYQTSLFAHRTVKLRYSSSSSSIVVVVLVHNITSSTYRFINLLPVVCCLGYQLPFVYVERVKGGMEIKLIL